MMKSMNRLHRLSFGDVARENRRSWPEHTAVVDGDVRLTYAALDERASRLSHVLLQSGVRQGDRLLWLGQNSFRVLEVLIAAAKVGAVLCVSNWRQTEDETVAMLEDWNPRVVFWEPREAHETSAIDRLRPHTSAIWVECGGTGADDYETRVAAASADDPELDVDPACGLIALYTGAFDGQPHAAVLSHDAIIAHNLAIALQRRVEAGAFRYLVCGPLFHVGTMMWLTATFHLAGVNVFMTKFDADQAARLIEAERIQSMLTVPAMLDELARVNADGRYDLSSLEAPPLSELLTPMVSADTSPFGRALGGYGQTEVGGFMTYAGLGGRTSPLLHVRIHDEDDNEVPAGDVGEIVARGLHIMNEYHDRADLTAQRQRSDWHHTGDLGRREPDGAITFIGPKRRMIKSGSENIYVAEVEQALKRHDEIQDAAVIGIPDPRWEQSVKAIVVRTPGSELDENDVVAHCRSLIASYKKPREVVFASSIPRQGYDVDYDALDAEYGGGGYPGSGR